MLHLNRAGNPYVGSAWFKTFLEVHIENPNQVNGGDAKCALKHVRSRMPRVGVSCVLDARS